MKRLVTENVGMKLLSLALAGLLWVAIVGEQELSSSVSVPVEYKNFPKSLEASSEMVSRVNLLVHAPPEKLEAGNLAGAALVVDLTEVTRPGERTFNLDRQSLRLPQGVTLERVIPSQIRLRFEQRTARDVPVIIRYANTPMPGYRILKQEVYPEVLRVVGPQSRVEELQSAETDPIDLSGVLSEAELRVNTFVADGQVRIEGPSLVRVRIIMERIAQPALEQ
ncbi:MAG: CdaR family protein [Acidobacteria bacterium]|nr:CdaR family protein [Acidobacteriota bacterium]